MNLLDMRDYVLHLRDLARDSVKEWHDRMSHWRRLYDFDHYRQKPLPHEKQYQDPAYTNAVDLAVGVLLGSGLDWKAQGWTVGPANDKNTSRIEKYLAGLLDTASERNEYSVIYDTMLQLCRDGSSVLYSVWDPKQALAQKRIMPVPDERGRMERRTVYMEPPIVTQVIDPLKIALIAGGPRRWSHVFRMESMTVYEVEQLYGRKLQNFVHLSTRDKMLTKGTFLDFWEIVTHKEGMPQEYKAWYDDGHIPIRNAVMFEDEFVYPLRWMPGYDDLPYTIGFFKPIGRDVPENWGHGIIRPMESSVEMLERSVNRRDRQITMYSALPLITKTVNGKQIAVDPGLGGAINLSLEEDIGFPAWPGSPPDVNQQMQFAEQRTQQASFPSSVYGAGMDQSSGYALSQQNDQARIRLNQPTDHLVLLWSTWAKKVMRLTRNLGGDALIRVYGRMRGRDFAEQVNGMELEGYKVRAVIKPVFPNEESRRHAMGTQTADVLSARTRREKYYGIEQPEEEERQVQREKMMEHPLMQQLAMMIALRELAEEGGVEGEVAATILQQVQAQGIPGQGGRPVEPRNPEQPLGLASPTGMPTPQEQGVQPFGQGDISRLMSQVPAAQMTE